MGGSHKGGSIINIASISVVLGNPNDVAYTVSNTLSLGLARAAAAAELGVSAFESQLCIAGPIESSP